MAKAMTLQGRPVGERFMERRAEYFGELNQMTDEQIENMTPEQTARLEETSRRWHKIANRYQKWVAKITVRRMIASGEYHPEAN